MRPHSLTLLTRSISISSRERERDRKKEKIRAITIIYLFFLYEHNSNYFPWRHLLFSERRAIWVKILFNLIFGQKFQSFLDIKVSEWCRVIYPELRIYDHDWVLVPTWCAQEKIGDHYSPNAIILGTIVRFQLILYLDLPNKIMNLKTILFAQRKCYHRSVWYTVVVTGQFFVLPRSKDGWWERFRWEICI